MNISREIKMIQKHIMMHRNYEKIVFKKETVVHVVLGGATLCSYFFKSKNVSLIPLIPDSVL